jgi:dimethylargininase
VVQGGKALICRMAKESRRGEESGVEEVLRGIMPVRRAASPATVEGGDVIHLPGRLISGITQRTNEEGVAQMQEFLGVPVDTIVDTSIVHLKSYVTYLGRGIMIAAERYAGHDVLRGFKVVMIPEGEEYAADTLAIGDTVFMPAGLPRAHEAVRELGFDVVPLELGEFEKCEGAITCLSIIF